MAFCILEIPYISAIDAFELFAHEKLSILLDSSSNNHALSRYSYIAVNPIKVITKSPLQEIDKFITNNFKLENSSDKFPTPFNGGIVGFTGYEFGKTLEDRSPAKYNDLEIPDYAFGIYDVIAAFDNLKQKAWVIAVDINNLSKTNAKKRAENLAKKLTASAYDSSEQYDVPNINWLEETSQNDFENMVKKTIECIKAGDIYQANITRRYVAELDTKLDYFGLYKEIRKNNPAPFSAYINIDSNHAILSASPERFLRLGSDGKVETRPIKGTRPRIQNDKLADLAMIKELQNSHKDQSENLMIVDLMRNDISKVCEKQSVKVPSLFNVETFENVHHIVSIVTGKLRKDKNASHLLASTFPGGSITGAPKIKAMEIINKLEPSKRGIYCGSIMWINTDGSMDSSIVIRTMIASKNTLVVQTGSGIVAESNPTDEYLETIDKVKALLI